MRERFDKDAHTHTYKHIHTQACQHLGRRPRSGLSIFISMVSYEAERGRSSMEKKCK
jgi:hypothetical protein